MARIAGITIERNAYGKARYVRIDLKRYADQLADFFYRNNVEIEESPYDPKFVDKIRDAEKQESKIIDLKKYGISI